MSSFPSTQWSVILRAQQGPEANAALATLCQAYWYPLYLFVRRQASAEEAQDLTQQFFSGLLEKRILADVDRRHGKFRAFLLACVKHFLANERDRQRAQKRGGGRTLLSLDFRAAEERFALEPADPATPERLFARRWALTLLDRVMDQLRARYQQHGNQALFDALKGSLTGKHLPYAQIAATLGLSEAAVKKRAQRFRQEYRDSLRNEIAATVADPDGIDGEIDDLFAALQS